MTTPMKNEYEMGSPEWQLFENANSARINSLTQAREAQQRSAQSQKERERAQRYEAALKKIDPDFQGLEW